jgi:hypothetical protein
LGIGLKITSLKNLLLRSHGGGQEPHKVVVPAKKKKKKKKKRFGNFDAQIEILKIVGRNNG